MPFVKKPTANKQVSSAIGIGNFFVGRADEIHFFVEHILVPEIPVHNILSISGQAGVGKTTLLTRFLDEVRGSEWKESCETALIDERTTGIVSVMEQFSKQLHLGRKFEKALEAYKESLRTLRAEHEATEENIWRKVTTELASSATKGVPVVGNILEKGTELALQYLFDEMHYRRLRTHAKQLDDPLGILTQSFIEDLNVLAETHPSSSTKQVKRSRRVFLCFDTFEQMSAEVVPWLLDYFLTAEISANVVLLIAGQFPVEYSPPSDPKRWLPYIESHTLYHFPLANFSQEETKTFLSVHGFFDEAQIAWIWHLSQGLPLYLGLLANNSQGVIDPTADVVANFLRWLPKQEDLKRRIVLDAALFSRPFCQDDLEAFSYLSEEERPKLYQWLMDQPFVQRGSIDDSRLRYHERVSVLFSRYLYQKSRHEYYTVRHALTNYYAHQVVSIETREGEEVLHSLEWYEVGLAYLLQIFFLPGVANHLKGIELVLHLYEKETRLAELMRVLDELASGDLHDLLTKNAQKAVNLLLTHLKADLADQEGQELAETTERLLQFVKKETSFSPHQLANLYQRRGKAYRLIGQYAKAMEDYNHALLIDSTSVKAYAGRGETYRLRGEYEQALQDLNQAMAIDPSVVWCYVFRGMVYQVSGLYDLALHDFDHTLTLSAAPFARVSLLQVTVYLAIGENERAISVLNDVVERYPQWMPAYVARGHTYSRLREYNRAIHDFDQALQLEPKQAWVYASRGEAYHLLQKYEKALKDFNQALQLDPSLDHVIASRDTVSGLVGWVGRLGWAGSGGGEGCPPPAFDPDPD